MLKVGLTGSIAVGKSFVCEVFRHLGCHVLDADVVAREVVAPGTPGLRMVAAAFGENVLATDGSLDRSKLAAVVFDDAEKRAQLNSIIHPLVIAAQEQWLAAEGADDPNGIFIIDAALMIESGSFERFDKIIVVWCRPELQLGRLMLRDGITRTEAEKRVRAQLSQDEKKRHADFLIDTSEGFEEARRLTEEVFRQLKPQV